MTRVALIGLGEVGAILADDLAARGATLSAWDILFANAGAAPARALEARAIRAARDTADAVTGANLVISAVTAAQTQTAAAAAAPALAPGAFYFDLNSASPGAKIAAAAAVNAAGARYVEVAVMAPIAPKRSASPILIGGPHAEDFAPLARDLGFSGVTIFSSEYGKASAAKLCRSVIVKGSEALLTEALLSARHYGVESTVIASLDNLFPGPDWTKLSRYMISRALEHGARRAEEMREAARTVREAGVAPLMSEAAAQRQDWAAGFRPALEGEPDLEALLDAIIARMESKTP